MKSDFNMNLVFDRKKKKKIFLLKCHHVNEKVRSRRHTYIHSYEEKKRKIPYIVMIYISWLSN